MKFFNGENLGWKIVGLVIGIPVLIFVVWFAYGFARTFYFVSNDYVEYKGKWYKQENLPREATEEFGDIRAKLRAAPTLRTPEETYSLFRTALLDGKYEDALQYIAEDKRENYREIFGDTKILEKYKKILPIKILKESEDEFNMSFYYLNAFDKNDKMAYSVDFEKNITGYWMITSI